LPDNGGPFANDSNAPGKPGEPPQDEDEIVAINEKGNNKFDNSSIDEDFASGLMSYSFGETSSIHNRLVQHNGPSFLREDSSQEKCGNLSHKRGCYVYSRDEYQAKSGNLAHNHGFCALHKENVDEVEAVLGNNVVIITPNKCSRSKKDSNRMGESARNLGMHDV